MAASPDELESKRIQFVETLSSVADAMRNCASMADEFALMLAQGPAKTGTATKRKAKDLEEDGEGKVKKKRQPRKPRDPNEPRRPASAYILFQNDVRRELKSQHPNVSQSELLNMISKQWNEMTDDQKSIYNQANRSAKEKYSVDKAAYDATKAPSADTVIAAPTPVEKKVAKPVKVTPKPEPKPVPTVQTTVWTPTSSDSSDEDDEEEEEEEEEEDVEQRPVKKPKRLPSFTREKRGKY